jgi:hypothetical protein
MQAFDQAGDRLLRKSSFCPLQPQSRSSIITNRAASPLLFIDETESLAGFKADWATVLDPQLSVSLFIRICYNISLK